MPSSNEFLKPHAPKQNMLVICHFFKNLFWVNQINVKKLTIIMKMTLNFRHMYAVNNFFSGV
jgi:hypothetical protein